MPKIIAWAIVHAIKKKTKAFSPLLENRTLLVCSDRELSQGRDGLVQVSVHTQDPR